jgi:hypothetical protein
MPDRTKTDHPAFGQVTAHRFSSTGTVCYGSSVEHHTGIRLRIHESTQYRALAQDRQHAGRAIVEVVLTEAQWATLVSSLNHGDGVPCTLCLRPTGPLKVLPGIGESYLTRQRTAHADDLRSMLKTHTDRLRAAAAKVTTKTLHRELSLIADALDGAAPFVADKFVAHTETLVEEAKQDIEGYLLVRGLAPQTPFEALGPGAASVLTPPAEEAPRG